LAGLGTLPLWSAGCRGVFGPVPSTSLDVSGDRPLAGATIHTKVLQEQVEREASSARAAAAVLGDEAVAAALAAAAAILRERRAAVVAANKADLEAAAGRLDAGMLDRLRLDVDAAAAQVEATAALAPLDREIGRRTLANGLDVAGQLLKSLNATVLRTGGAALRTVTVLVDEVLRPALEHAGLPPAAVGLVRSADREGA